MTGPETSPQPYRVAEETFIIPQFVPAPPVGFFYFNSMVIRAKEPVLVDTGSPIYRSQWLEHAWSLVDPRDVRWIFLSHDDRDHSGNLIPVLEACPNARLVTNWFSIGRMSEEWLLPLDRCVFVNGNESFDAGDRNLTAVVPPYFDSPTTRGLYDAKTGVYWSADAFAAALPHPCEDAAGLPEATYREGFLLANRLNHPWHIWLDEAKFARHVDRVQSLGMSAVASCHGPTVYGKLIDTAFSMIREIPGLDPWPLPTQKDLEALLAMMAGAAP